MFTATMLAEYDFRVMILRGTARILAAATGLLLMYGITFALEGMTTRIPATVLWELANGALWTAPWLLLFFSGLQDVVIVAGKPWVLWFGGFAALLFLYYFDQYTSLSLVTKAAMPPIVVGVGLMPHFIRKMGFLFVLSSLAAGIAGVSRGLCSVPYCPFVVFANGTPPRRSSGRHS